MTSNLKMSYRQHHYMEMNAAFKIKHSKSKGMQGKESNMSFWCG